MKVVLPSVEHVSGDFDEIMGAIDGAAWACCGAKRGDAEKDRRFLRNLISSGHESVLERGVVTLKVVCDRDVAHELVRRLPSGCSHDVAKKVLPGPTKAAEVVITANIREWRHFLELNAHISANPDIKAIADMALAIFIMGAQPLFEDLWEEANQNKKPGEKGGHDD